MHAKEDRAVYGLSIPWDLLETISILPTTPDPIAKLREFIRSAQLNAVEHANSKKAAEVYENGKAQRCNETEWNKDGQIASKTTVICSFTFSFCKVQYNRKVRTLSSLKVQNLRENE